MLRVWVGWFYSRRIFIQRRQFIEGEGEGKARVKWRIECTRRRGADTLLVDNYLLILKECTTHRQRSVELICLLVDMCMDASLTNSMGTNTYLYRQTMGIYDR